MNDESLPEYRNMLLQMETGLKFINETFGVHPWVAWQIDPFGNSAVTPALFSQLGYEAIILSWIGTTMYDDLEKEKSMEFIWTGANAGPLNNSLFAHALELSWYSSPVEFQFKPEGLNWWDKPKA